MVTIHYTRWKRDYKGEPEKLEVKGKLKVKKVEISIIREIV